MVDKKRITIIEVAETAGVSRQTVSRVLNDRPDVADETRERVQQVIQELSYRPSALARSLSQGTSCTLGIVGYGLDYYGPSRTLSVIEKNAVEYGYSIALTLVHDLEDLDIDQLLSGLIAQHVDGIIWNVPQIGGYRKRLLEAISQINTPVVCTDMLPQGQISLQEPNYVGGMLATWHLVKQGYRQIGIISGPSNWSASAQRLAGWQVALNEANLYFDENFSYEGNWSAASGYQGLTYLIEKNRDLDAVFVCNDQMALGALRAAAKIGKRVPEDLGLVGYDNIPESEYYSSPLTTIRQNYAEQGKKIVEEIERRIREKKENDEESMMVTFLRPELIVRESSVRNPEFNKPI